jgi:hypothetical protein
MCQRGAAAASETVSSAVSSAVQDALSSRDRTMSAAVEVTPATEQMFGSLAQLRLAELSQNFAGMTQVL